MVVFSTVPASQADIDGAYAWMRMAICLVLGTIGGVGSWSVVVVLPFVQEEFGVHRGDATLPYAATMVGFAAGNLLFGKLLDRYGSVVPVALSGVLLGAGFLLGSVAGSLATFTIIHGLIGMGASATFAPLLADISHWFARRRGIAVAATACGSYLAGVLWPLLMQPLISWEDWRFCYIVISVICVATILPIAAALRRPSPRDGVPQSETAKTAPTRLLTAGMSPRQLQVLLVIAGISCCIAMSMPQIHIIAYCTDLGYGPARGAEMLALMMAAGIASRLLSGVLTDYLGGVKTLLIGSFGQMIGLLLYISADGLVSLYIVSLVFGLSQGGIVPSYTIIVREYLPAREAGGRVGIVMMATILGMAAGGWMSGAIYDWTGSYTAAFLNGSLWNMLNISVMCLILFRSRRRPAIA